MRHYNQIALFLILMGICGCSLKGAPDCVSGEEQCHNDELKMGIYQMCTLNDAWGSPLACGGSCDGNRCGDDMVAPVCYTDGENRCVEVDSSTDLRVRALLGRTGLSGG